MKKTLLLLVILIMAVYTASAQNVSDTISVQKRMGTIFIRDGAPLSADQLSAIARPYPEARAEIKKAQGYLLAGSVFSYTGGFLIGYPIGTAIGGGEPVWAMAAVGAGLIAVAIPFSAGYSKHAKNAVRIINNELKQEAVSQVQLKFGPTHDGLGLSLTF